LSFEVGVLRKYGFYIWKVLVPLFIIVAISWVVFWMSHDGLARRAGVSVTGILTVIAYQFIISESLPRVSYLTALDKIMLLSVVMIAATMLINIFAGRFGPERSHMTERVDSVCRWAFPLLYIGGVVIIIARNLSS
jgi:hypothetical protein